MESLLLQGKCTNWEDIVKNFRVNGNLDDRDNEIRALMELNTERKIISK